MLNDGALEVVVGLVGLNLFTFSVLHMLLLFGLMTANDDKN